MSCEIKVVDQKGNPQDGVHIGIYDPQVEIMLETVTTKANGVVRFRVNWGCRLEIFVNHKSYGMYFLDDGADITIII